jgi:hypothetical protein
MKLSLGAGNKWETGVLNPLPPVSAPRSSRRETPQQGWRFQRSSRRSRLAFARSDHMSALCPRKPIEIPPAAARSFVKAMRAYHATSDSIEKDEIAARQAWLLSEHLGPREKKLRLIDVRQMFVDMKDQA